MTRPRRAVPSLLALFAVVFLAGCGDDDAVTATTSAGEGTVSDAASTAGPPTTSAPPTTVVVTVSTDAPATTGGASPKSAEEVVAAYFAAIAVNDGATACTLVNPEDMSNLGTDPSQCADDLSSFPPEDTEVFAEVEVVGEVLVESEQCDPGDPDEGFTAVEVTARGETECVSLELVGDRWLIEDL